MRKKINNDCEWGDYSMPWLLAYLLIFLNIILLVLVATFTKSWASRIIGCTLLVLPIPIYMLKTGYFTAYYQHVRDCKADGGLKVLIQPEKVAHVQLRFDSMSSGEPAAQSYLHEFYPHLKQVEAVGDSTESITKPNQFFSYSVASTSTSNRSSNWQEEWVFNKTPLTAPSDDMYVISEHREDSSDKNVITKYEWRLSRNNKIYAKITDYSHMWRGIQYPDAIPSWNCSDRNSPDYASSVFAYPNEDLLRLILK